MHMMLSSANSSQPVPNGSRPVVNSSSQIIDVARDMPNKGKLSSKLSSRRNRRKRRDSKERSAKKSRCNLRNKDRIPIPSFTPLTQDDHDGGAVNGGENAGTAGLETLKSSSRCPTERDLNQRNSSEPTKLIANTAAEKASTSAINVNSTNQAEKKQTIDFIHSKATDRLSCSVEPLDNEQTPPSKLRQKPMNVFNPIQSTTIGNIENVKVDAGEKCTSIPTTENSQHAAKQKNSSTSPTERTSAASSPSMTDVALPRSKGKPSTPSVTKHGLSRQYSPFFTDDSEVDTPQGHRLQKSDHSGVGKSKYFDVKIVDEICCDPKKDKMKATEINAEASSIGNCLAGTMGENFQQAAKQKNSTMLPESVSGTSSPTLPEAAQRMEKSQPSVQNSATEDASSSRCLPPAVKATGLLGVGKGKNTTIENKCARVKEKISYGVNKEAQTHPRNETPDISVDTPGENTESDLEIEALIDDFSAKKAKNFMSNKSRSPPATYQPNKEQKPCDGYVVRSASSAKKTQCKHDKAGPPEVIEIIDDDDHDGDVNKEAIQNAKSKQSLNTGTTEKNKNKLNKSNQRREKRKEPVNISRTSSDSSSEDELIRNLKKSRKTSDNKGSKRRRNQKAVKLKETTPRKQLKTSAGKNLCFACSSCKCDSRAGTAATPQKFSTLAGSDARQEQSLVNRLQRIERDISWKDGQRNDVARELRKHRHQMLKKWESQPSNTRGKRPRFLADVEETEDLGDLHPKMSLKETKRARSQMFGNQKTHQPTLTQIIRGPKNDDGDEEHPTSENQNEIISDFIDASIIGSKNANGAPGVPSKPYEQHGATSPGDEDEYLSFWDDSVPMKDSTQCLGSMDSFNRAIVDLNTRKSVGIWAKATANTLQMKDEEGFDALVELFDASMECNRSDECEGCLSQNSFDPDDDDCIIDEGPVSLSRKEICEAAANEIKTSVEENPTKMVAIERMCPNWKENVELCQAQTDTNALHNALQNVQQAKEDLEIMKERIFQAFLDRHQTLDLYERSIQVAIAGSAKEDQCAD